MNENGGFDSESTRCFCIQEFCCALSGALWFTPFALSVNASSQNSRIATTHHACLLPRWRTYLWQSTFVNFDWQSIPKIILASLRGTPNRWYNVRVAVWAAR